MAITEVSFLKQSLENMVMGTKKKDGKASVYESMSQQLAAETRGQGQTEEGSSLSPMAAGGRTEVIKGSRLQMHLAGEKKAPYSHLAKDGVIAYNGVTFYCDTEKNQLCLGDTSNREDCIYIPLEQGGTLVVNRENLGDLSQAIGMFSPEDVNRIMRAIHQDAKVRQVQEQIKDEEARIGQELQK